MSDLSAIYQVDFESSDTISIAMATAEIKQTLVQEILKLIGVKNDTAIS